MAIGNYRHHVTLDEPGDPVPDGDGGYTETYTPLEPPTWECSIEQPSLRSLESLGAGSVVAQATHVLTGRYHKGMTTRTRVTFEGRTLNALQVKNIDERDIKTVAVCAEVVK